MSFAELKKIAEQDAVVHVRTSNKRNVPLRVESYDLLRHTVSGIDLVTNEEVTVTLRPDPMASERRVPRSEITDFAGRGANGVSSPAHTQVGGVILFDYVYPDPAQPGILSARWGHPYSRFDGECDVFVAQAAPFVSSTGKFAMDVVRTMAATSVTNLDDLRSRIEEALYHSFAGAVIRATDNVDTVMFTNDRSDRIERIKVVNGKAVPITAQEAIDGFFATPFGQALARSLDDDAYSQDFVVEVLPVERIYANRDTQTLINTRDKLEAWHQMGSGVGYAETILAVRENPNGGSFLTGRPVPVDTLPELYHIKNVPTPNIAPLVAPYIAAQHGHGLIAANDGVNDTLEATFVDAGADDAHTSPQARMR